MIDRRQSHELLETKQPLSGSMQQIGVLALNVSWIR